MARRASVVEAGITHHLARRVSFLVGRRGFSVARLLRLVADQTPGPEPKVETVGFWGELG